LGCDDLQGRKRPYGPVIFKEAGWRAGPDFRKNAPCLAAAARFGGLPRLRCEHTYLARPIAARRNPGRIPQGSPRNPARNCGYQKIIGVAY